MFELLTIEHIIDFSASFVVGIIIGFAVMYGLLYGLGLAFSKGWHRGKRESVAIMMDDCINDGISKPYYDDCQKECNSDSDWKDIAEGAKRFDKNLKDKFDRFEEAVDEKENNK